MAHLETDHLDELGLPCLGTKEISEVTTRTRDTTTISVTSLKVCI